MVAERHRDKQVIIVAGPTASGKSALALAIAERFGGEIINADSMQVYREFRVLTARPSTAEEARTSHHLYGILPSMESCSAGFWLEMALDVIADLHRRRRVPVVCGGTGLYLKVLMEGIAPMPLVPPKLSMRRGSFLSNTEVMYSAKGWPNSAQVLGRNWRPATGNA